MIIDQSTVREATIEAIAQIGELAPDTIRMSDRIREDLGMDSLGSLELLSSLSEQFRIDLEIDAALGIVTVADACRFVEESYVAQRGPSSEQAKQGHLL